MSEVVLLFVALTVVSGGIVFLASSISHSSSNNLSLSADVIPVYGGGSLPSPLSEPVSSIVNLMVCSDVPVGASCLPSGFDDSVVVYWEVLNGVGCCHTFGCNYDLFTAFCGSPYNNFKLYDIALDGVLFDWSSVTALDDYSYNCSNGSIWNFKTYENLSVGQHSFKVFQKDCLRVVDVETINFIVSKNDNLWRIDLYG